MPTKKIFKNKDEILMFNRSNCDRKSQLSGVLTNEVIVYKVIMYANPFWSIDQRGYSV